MYKWFWSLLEVLGITVRIEPFDMADINPLHVPWAQTRFKLTWFGREIGGGDGR